MWMILDKLDRKFLHQHYPVKRAITVFPHGFKGRLLLSKVNPKNAESFKSLLGGLRIAILETDLGKTRRVFWGRESVRGL